VVGECNIWSSCRSYQLGVGEQIIQTIITGVIAMMALAEVLRLDWAVRIMPRMCKKIAGSDGIGYGVWT
jgi:hypothetical protein